MNDQNLKPPKKGEIRNPNGRGLGVKNRSTLLKKWIEVNAKFRNPITKETEQGTVEDMIVIALITKAIAGDIQAIKEVYDTRYGKLQDSAKIDASISIEYSKLTKAQRRKRIAELTQKLLKK